jgi:hypothetical protein
MADNPERTISDTARSWKASRTEAASACGASRGTAASTRNHYANSGQEPHSKWPIVSTERTDVELQDTF